MGSFDGVSVGGDVPCDLLEGEARQLSMLIAVVVLTVVTALVIRSRLSRRYWGRAGRAVEKHTALTTRSPNRGA